MSTDPSTPDMESKIKTWMDGQGYPLEMRVARSFDTHKFLVSAPEYYEDQETKKYREIDVIARTYGRITDKVTIGVTFVVECKTSYKNPWVMLKGIEKKRRIRNFEDHPSMKIVGSEAVPLLNMIASNIDLPFFVPTRSLGYGLVTAFKANNADITFGYTKDVLKASIDHFVKNEEFLKVFGDFATSSMEIVIPIIVVDGRLFECQLDENSEISVKEVDSCGIRFGYPVPNRENHESVIEIVTAKKLDAFTKVISEKCEKFFEACRSPDMSDLVMSCVENMKKRRKEAS